MSVNVSKTPTHKYIYTREVLLTFFVLLISVVLFILWKRSQKAKHDVLIVGLRGSGKTSLFNYLLYKLHINATPSYVEKFDEIKIKNNFLRLVDIPGNEKLFTKCWDIYKKRCKGVIFVVNLETLYIDLYNVAVLLYRILIDETILSNKSKIIILCNKEPHVILKSGVFKFLLEQQLDLMRMKIMENQYYPFHDIPECINNKENNILGNKRRKHFEFFQCPVQIQIAEVIVPLTDIEIKPIIDWMKTIE